MTRQGRVPIAGTSVDLGEPRTPRQPSDRCRKGQEQNNSSRLHELEIGCREEAPELVVTIFLDVPGLRPIS
jgi:hypothetical protein